MQEEEARIRQEQEDQQHHQPMHPQVEKESKEKPKQQQPSQKRLLGLVGVGALRVVGGVVPAGSWSTQPSPYRSADIRV